MLNDVTLLCISFHTKTMKMSGKLRQKYYWLLLLHDSKDYFAKNKKKSSETSLVGEILTMLIYSYHSARWYAQY